MTKNKVLVFNQHASYITIDIVNALAQNGNYESVVLMSGVINVREDCLDSTVTTVKTKPYNKSSLLSRFLSWLSAFIHFLVIRQIRYPTHHLLLFSNPPLTTFVPYFTKCTYDAIIFDVYPDALESNRFISSKSFLYKMWIRANNFFFNKAGKVITISVGLKERISRYCEPSKIRVMPLWSSFSPIIIPKQENTFIINNDLKDKFIIMYSGNMGKQSGLETLINVAQLLANQKDIIFIFIGEGWIKSKLETLAIEKSLDNCLFMPYQDVSLLKHSLSAADISVVTLPPDSDSVSIPNKTYTLLALGRPLICLSNPASELSLFIENNQVGKSFSIDETTLIVDYITMLKNNKLLHEELKENAIKCSNQFTKKNLQIIFN